jgi:hypothetical protein
VAGCGVFLVGLRMVKTLRSAASAALAEGGQDLEKKRREDALPCNQLLLVHCIELFKGRASSIDPVRAHSSW